MRLFLPAFLKAPARARAAARPAVPVLLTALVLGGLVAAGQAPLGYWWLALAALGLFLPLAAHAALRGPSGAGWAGFVAGFGYGLATMFWIAEPFLVEPEVYGWMAPFATALMAAGMGLFWAIGAALGVRLAGRAVRGLFGRRVAGIALGLVAMDAFRSYAFTGFPWVLFGHIWIDTPVAQAAALIGPIGLSALSLFLAALPSLLPTALWRRHSLGRVLGGAAAVLLLALLWGAGAARLSAPVAPRNPPVNLRLVQPNATQALKWDPDYAREFFYRHLDLTAAPPAPGVPPADLVIWPETAVPFLLNDPGAGLEMIAEAAHGAPVALGIQRAEGPRYFNSLVLLQPDGRVGPVYDKVHLVPFGEYIPFGDVLARFGITAFAAQQGNGYTAGQGDALMDLGPLGRALPLICYESIFPQDVRRVRARADWILLVTNDAWFGAVSGPWQHLAQARLRAIEFGLPVARAANTGVSAMIDAKGQVVAELGMNRQGVIDAALPGALPATVYSRTGDAPVIGALALLAGLVLAFGRNNRVDRAGPRV